jgi:D-alanyl-D-alanine dipeptidase
MISGNHSRLSAGLGLMLLALAAAAQTRPGIFRIQPVRPVAELRAEALAAHPPVEHGSFLASDLVDLAALDPHIKLDIRYATSDNFLSTPVYSSARAFLERPAAEALLRAQRDLLQQGYGLLIFDAYRPWYVTKIFWDATPPDKHEFVADPAEGSRHNRGCAVDLSLYDLKTGREIEMTGGYDEMSERSYPDYAGGTAGQRAHRQVLRSAMEKQGFSVYPSEWWHFDYRDWKQYPIQNVPFEMVRPSSRPRDSSANREDEQQARSRGCTDPPKAAWNGPNRPLFALRPPAHHPGQTQQPGIGAQRGWQRRCDHIEQPERIEQAS